MRLIRPRAREINIDVFANPEKYLMCLPIEKIVADTKVSEEAIEMYKQKIQNGENISPIIVLKHPKLDVYAVVDGHHRYYACLEMGRKEIEYALAGDFSSVLLYITEHGFFQPNLETKGEMQKPVLKLHENIQDFLQNFLKDPDKLKKAKRTNDKRRISSASAMENGVGIV
jgi:ParB-like chromosome segregation protein Spo0J